MPEIPRLPSAFGRLAGSNLAAQSAEQITLAAAPIVAVLAFGAREGETGLLQIALTLPFLLFAIPAGLLADRVSRQGLMVGAESLRALALLATLALLQAGLLNWQLLALLGFVGACGTVAYSVATPTLVPALVPAALLGRANARIELGRTLAFAGGPALGGALVGWIGAGPAFAAAAALSLMAAALLAGGREPPRSPSAGPPSPRSLSAGHPLRDVADGIAFVARHAVLRPVLVTQLVFNTAFFVIFAVFVPYAIRHLGLSASGVGVTLSVFGVGMVIGALLAPMMLRRVPFGVVIGVGPVSGLLASLAMALTIWVPTPLLAALSFFLFGLGPILWVISTTTLRQSVTPPSLLGRVSALNILAYGARPLGGALGAGVGAWLGAEACLLLAVPGFIAQAAIIWRSPAVKLARQPEMMTETPPVSRESDQRARRVSPPAAG